ncbi:MAG: fasciclin domain-containing protein [Pseudomonadota bacterium]
MNVLRRLLVVAMIALPIGAGFSMVHASQKDIVETAEASGQFSTLITAVKAAGLEETLKGSGPYTVFAPTDEAFAKLPPETLQNLLKPENKQQLAAILSYHVVPGKVLSADLDGKNTTATTVQGQDVTIDASDGVRVNDATVTAADVEASNGVVHAIDTVIMPTL